MASFAPVKRTAITYLLLVGAFGGKASCESHRTPRSPTMSRLLLLLALLCLSLPVHAQDDRETDPELAAIIQRRTELEASLQYQAERVVLKEGLATIELGDRLRYLSSADTDRVLQEWGNPPMPDSFGMLVPAGMSVFHEDSWAVLITYLEDGHVEDDDADELDYADLLEQMQEETKAGNERRRELGLTELSLIGWAEPAHYDSEHHHLYWARELRDSNGVSTLNYDIRLLGRKGVLSLNALTSMHRLDVVRDDMQHVLTAVRFEPGHRYDDFDPDVDEVAAYGLGALIVGKLASKAGIFAGLLAVLVKAKKLLVLGTVGAVAVLKRVFGAKGGTEA